METKICKKCNIEKNINEFYSNKTSKDGYYHICKICYNKIKHSYQKEYYKNNKIKVSKYQKTYRENKKNEFKEYKKKWQYEKRATDPLHKLKHTISRSIRQALKKKGYKKNHKTYEILGCSYEEFKIYLESKFEPWMTYDNHGLYKKNEYNIGWDIDHIIPIDTATNEDEIIALNHYTNLQPLCSKINRDIKKNNKDYE